MCLYFRKDDLVKKKRKQWTQQEKELLKKIYPTTSWDEMIEIFQTSKDNITHKAKNLGIKREMVNYAKYTQEEVQYIKDNYGKISSKEMAERLGRTAVAIETKIKKLKLNKRTLWTNEEIELLKKVFPKYGNEELAEIFFENRSPKAIAGMARKLNLYKEDLPPQKQKQFNKDELLEKIKEVKNKLGRTPLITELRLYGLPSERSLLRYFPQGYRELCKELGWKLNLSSFGRPVNYYSKNGDICLSMAEMIITDFFIDNNIDYIKDEAQYKIIFGYEEFGQKRMDWLIKHNEVAYVVEYFGMLTNEDYKERMNSKLNLCKKYNIPLIELYPNNIKDLPQIFKNFIKK